MKKLLTIIILILCCVSLQAQPPSVAGVQFGSTYEQAKTILDKRFNGGKDSYQLDKNRITYYGVTFADEYFTHVDFEFEVDTKSSYLSNIIFCRSFKLSESKKAKVMRDRLLKMYKSKYNFRWENINDDNYKYYVLGYEYFNRDNGFVLIETYKAETNSHIMKLWTILSYSCNGFINTQDEI